MWAILSKLYLVNIKYASLLWILCPKRGHNESKPLIKFYVDSNETTAALSEDKTKINLKRIPIIALLLFSSLKLPTISPNHQKIYFYQIEKRSFQQTTRVLLHVVNEIDITCNNHLANKKKYIILHQRKGIGKRCQFLQQYQSTPSSQVNP